MNAYNFAVKSQDANARILAAAKQIAPRYAADVEVAALAVVKDKDPQTEQVKRLEAVADLLERIANTPVTVPHVGTPLPKQTEPTISADKSDVGTFRRSKR